VRQFVYTTYLPGCKKTVLIKELQYNRFKHLVKNITNDNSVIIASFFDDLLNDLCIDEPDVASYTFIDKLILLLTIRSICISPDLELTATCPETESTFKFTVQLFDIIQTLQQLNLPDNIYSSVKTYNGLTIELGMPDMLNLAITDLDVINTIIKKITLNGKDISATKEQIIDHLPTAVLKDAKEYLTSFSNTLKDINLLSIQSPFSKTNQSIEIPLNLFSNSIIEFLKICFKRSLISLYELEYALLNKVKLDYELIKTSTPAELSLYINIFKDDKREESKSQNPDPGLNLAPP